MRRSVITAALCAMAATPAAAQSTTNLANPDHGPVLRSPRVHLVFWLPAGLHLETTGSDATDGVDQQLMAQFVQDLGGSAFFNLLNQYDDGRGGRPTSISFADSDLYNAPYPNNEGSTANPLLDSDVKTAIESVRARHRDWYTGLDNLYVLVTAATEQLCTTDELGNINGCTFSSTGASIGDFCGFHNYIPDAQPVVFAWVSGGGIAGCDLLHSSLLPPTPNGPEADGMVSKMSHEIFEAITDPLVTSWSDASGEIGDKCFSKFGQPIFGRANLVLNGHAYAVQEEWSNDAFAPSSKPGVAVGVEGYGTCQMSMPAITNIVPMIGPNGGQGGIVIEGAGFDSTTQVLFGTTPATFVSCTSSNQCLVGAPANGYPDTRGKSQTVPVTVTTGGYTSAVELPITHFTYRAGPSCTTSFMCKPGVGGPPEMNVACTTAVTFFDASGRQLASGTSYTGSATSAGSGEIIACECPHSSAVYCQAFGCQCPGAGSSCTAFSTTTTQLCESPPPTCDGQPRPKKACAIGWRCCDDGWSCRPCQ
jgi:hypothetical protein